MKKKMVKNKDLKLSIVYIINIYLKNQNLMSKLTVTI